MLGSNTLTRGPISTEKNKNGPHPGALSNAITAEDLEKSFVEDSEAHKLLDNSLPPPPGFNPSVPLDRLLKYLTIQTSFLS